jgi:hypothetical protein
MSSHFMKRGTKQTYEEIPSRSGAGMLAGRAYLLASFQASFQA